MIKHVVLFKLKEFDTQEEKQLILDEFKSKLLALKNKIDELKFIEVGLHHDINSPLFDLCLISHFESVEALERYRVHPEHKKVTEFVNTIKSNRAAVDFEF